MNSLADVIIVAGATDVSEYPTFTLCVLDSATALT